MADVEIIDHSDEIKEELEAAMARALKECGLAAERSAKKIITANGSVVTGLLRNSITHAMDGETTAIGAYKADRPKGKSEGKAAGSYTGMMPKEDEGRAVYVGTNVEYATYVEVGSSKRRPKPFLKPAVENNKAAFNRIFQKHLKNS